MLFADKLKKIRKEKDLSQDKMSDLLFMSQSNYCKYETNKKQPSINLLLLVSKQFNIPIQELMPDAVMKNIEIGNLGLHRAEDNSITKELLDTLLRQLNETNFFMQNIINCLKGVEKLK